MLTVAQPERCWPVSQTNTRGCGSLRVPGREGAGERGALEVLRAQHAGRAGNAASRGPGAGVEAGGVPRAELAPRVVGLAEVVVVVADRARALVFQLSSELTTCSVPSAYLSTRSAFSVGLARHSAVDQPQSPEVVSLSYWPEPSCEARTFSRAADASWRIRLVTSSVV